MNVVLIRTNKVDPDPRVEKEVDALLDCENISIKVIAWDITEKYKRRSDVLQLPSGSTQIIRFGIPSTWGGGMRKNLLPYIGFNLQLFIWLIKNYKSYDCVHACDLSTALPALIPILLFRKKFVYDIYDYFADTKSKENLITKTIKRIENKIIGIADVTIICSEKRTEQINLSRPKRLEIIHNSPARNQVKIVSKTSCRICLSNTSAIRLVYVGNLIDNRWVRQMIEVISEMKEVELHIGGIGIMENYVKEKALENDNIYFYGKMQYDKVLQLENECDIMLALYDPNVPNHKYAAPNKFYEALFIGKPIIMFHNTGMDEIIDQNDVGVTVHATNASLKKGIQRLIERKNEWPLMSKKLNKLYREEYSWDIMKDRLIQVYKYIQAN